MSNNNSKPPQLDTTQYTIDDIHHYESVFGQDFVSPGGKSMAHELVSTLALKPGSQVLDAGCGLGGAAFMMASEFGLQIEGIDVSANMIQQANERNASYGLQDQVSLVHGDCLDLDRHNEFDAVYSRDVFLHIENKVKLLSVLLKALKPGGTLLFTDYCCGPRPWSTEFSQYVSQRGYKLSTLEQYHALLQQAGFDHVASEDMTARFISILQQETTSIQAADLATAEKNSLLQSWAGKLTRARIGDHRWGLVTGQKAIAIY